MMMNESYEEHLSRVKEEQANMTKEEVLAMLEARSEHAVDLDNLPVSKHNWVKRGAKVSCEGADHPHHSHFLAKR